jgi:hypothetical protein
VVGGGSVVVVGGRAVVGAAVVVGGRVVVGTAPGRVVVGATVVAVEAAVVVGATVLLVVVGAAVVAGACVGGGLVANDVGCGPAGVETSTGTLVVVVPLVTAGCVGNVVVVAPAGVGTRLLSVESPSPPVKTINAMTPSTTVAAPAAIATIAPGCVHHGPGGGSYSGS